MKMWGFTLPLLLLVSGLLVGGITASAADAVQLISTENHHVVELNSNQPYVAGYHVITPDLYTRVTVNSTAITVSFPSTSPDHFPAGHWLGGGMFVQAQDTKFKYVDYAFYTILALDSSGRLFVDVGLHQTRESTAPLQAATEELLYAYTWQVLGMDYGTPGTLTAAWDTEGYVHYALSTSEINISIASINVAGLPNCENIIRRFYAGNVPGTAFPFGHYSNYFQFGVVSSGAIADNQWSVDLKEPKILRKSEWSLVDTAWSTQGDISYLDYDWRWGGAPYNGVSAQYYGKPLDNPWEVIFSNSGQTLRRGTVLWQHTSSRSENTGDIQRSPSNIAGSGVTDHFSIKLVVAGVFSLGLVAVSVRRKIEIVNRRSFFLFPNDFSRRPPRFRGSHA